MPRSVPATVTLPSASTRSSIEASSSSPASLFMLVTSLAVAICMTGPPVGMEREPKVPPPPLMMSVSPCTILIFSSGRWTWSDTIWA